MEKLDPDMVITARLNKVFLGLYPVRNEPVINVREGEIVIGKMLGSDSQSLYSLYLDLTAEFGQLDLYEWERELIKTNRNFAYQLWWREVMRENDRPEMFARHATTLLEVRRDWVVVQTGNL